MGERVDRITILNDLSQGKGLPTTSPEEAWESVNFHRRAYEKARYEWLRHRLGTEYGGVFFGSAQVDTTSPEFTFTSKLAKDIVLESDGAINIITGAGAGIMLAAHQGAEEGRGELRQQGKDPVGINLGVNIYLPFGQDFNGYSHVQSTHDEFSTRLQEFVDLTNFAFFAPGGLGTNAEDSLFLQLKQVQHLEEDFLLIAHPFWKKTIQPMLKRMYYGRIREGLTPLVAKSDINSLVNYSDDISSITKMVIDKYLKWENVVHRPAQEAMERAKNSHKFVPNGNGLYIHRPR